MVFLFPQHTKKYKLLELKADSCYHAAVR